MNKTKMKINGKSVVDEDKLTDIPSRLFRKIWDKLVGNTTEGSADLWRTYIDDWARLKHPDDPKDMQSVKVARSTTIGNITKEIWQSTNLTFNKLLTAISIIKAKRINIIVKVTFEDDEVIEVNEEYIITKDKQIKK